jgi:hypothetical protein
MNMYDAISSSAVLISRFSSAIIESLCLGTPAVYFNPGIEQVDKFAESLNAFDTCTDSKQLTTALISIRQNQSALTPCEITVQVRERAREFLELHCAIDTPTATPTGLANFMYGCILDQNTRNTTANHLNLHSSAKAGNSPITLSGANLAFRGQNYYDALRAYIDLYNVNPLEIYTNNIRMTCKKLHLPSSLSLSEIESHIRQNTTPRDIN